MCICLNLKTENTGMVRSELPRSVCVCESDCTPLNSFSFLCCLYFFFVDCGEYVCTSPFDVLFDCLAIWEIGANEKSVCVKLIFLYY